jgi:hypothetical protein
MSGFFSKIFGAFTGGSRETPAKAEQMQMIGDYRVFATPMRDGAQYRLAGRIEVQKGEELLVRRFIRADLFASEDDAVEVTFRKAKQIIDQHGASLFGDGVADRTV